jgi:hypothetical protein
MSRAITSVPSRDDPGPGWDTPVWHPQARTGSGHEHLISVTRTGMLSQPRGCEVRR